MSCPKISIIIPTYNRASIIGETLDSIINQAYTHWECIVVDDGSTDDTAKLLDTYIKKDNRFRYYTRPANKQKGPCSCRNYGFEKSKGDFINFFDSDDLLHPDTFSSWLQGFQNKEDAVISKIALVNFITQKVSKVYEIESKNRIQDFFLGKINYFVCGPLWRKSFLVNQEMLFNETIRNGDDWDFNLRMLYANPKLQFLDKAFIQNRLHVNSLSKERHKLNKEELVSYFDTIDYHLKCVHNRTDVDKKIAEDYVISKYSSYLLFCLNTGNSLHLFLYWRLLKNGLALGYYKQMGKTTIGYISYLLFGKGYSYINFKSISN